MKKSLLFAMLVVLLLISSCGGANPPGRNIPPTSTVQPSPTPIQQLPGVPDSGNSIVLETPQKKTSVLFLIDRSNSVKSDCAFANARYDIPYFIISLFKGVAKDNADWLRFGIKFFSIDNNTVIDDSKIYNDSLYLPSESIPKINLNIDDFKKQINDTHDEKNNFIAEIDNAVRLLNADDEGKPDTEKSDEKLIILISDGYLNYLPQTSDDKTKVQEKIETIKRDANIKLVLFHLGCKSPYGSDNQDAKEFDKTVWNHIEAKYHYSNDPALSSITLAAGIQTLIDSTSLGSYLPTDGKAGWLLNAENEKDVTMPGDMYAFKSIIIALGAKDINFFDAKGIKTRGDLISKNGIIYNFEFDNTNYDPKLFPVSNCVDYPIKIKTDWQDQSELSSVFVEYYVVRPTSFAYPGEASKIRAPWVKVITDGINGSDAGEDGIVLWNNEQFNIKINKQLLVEESNGDVDLLEKYGRCYEVWTSIPEEEDPHRSQIDIKKISLRKFDDGSVNENEFQVENVSLPPVNRSTDLTARVDIVKFPYANDGPEISVASFTANIHLRFYPILSPDTAPKEKDNNYSVTLDYATENYYGGGYMNIYALNKSNDGVMASECKSPEPGLSVYSDDGQKYYARLVEDSYYKTTLSDKGLGDVDFDISLNGFENDCGYDYLLFQWVNGKDGVENRNSVLCSIHQELVNCNSSKFQVVGQ